MATEAFFLLADHIMSALRYRRWQWRCNARNEPSRRAALRFGFPSERVVCNHMVVKRENRDTAGYSITDEERPAIGARFAAWLDPADFDPDGGQRTALR